MKRTLIIAVFAALGIAGCGGSGTSTSSHQPAPTAAHQTTYFNMTLLASDIQGQWNKNLRRLDAGRQIAGVTCIKSGAQTADCIGTYRGGASDGQRDTLTVTIAADGQSYITHAN